MPEVIEARNYADLIQKKIINKPLIKISVLGGRYKKKKPLANISAINRSKPTVIEVGTKGKLIYINFDNGYTLISKLGLVGGWCYYDNSKKKFYHSRNVAYYSRFMPSPEIKKYMKNSMNHLNVALVFKSGILYYYDMLSYGTLTITKNIADFDAILRKLGPDIMCESTNLDIFTSQLTKKKALDKPIANVLLDQTIISGIGNYLRAEILYCAGINPFRLIRDLSTKEISKLYNCAKAVIWSNYDYAQAKKLSWVNSKSIVPANFNRLFLVYRQDTDAYGNKVKTARLKNGSGDRTIYYVESMQK